MGKIQTDHTGSGAGITLSSDGTALLLDGAAIGGGGGSMTLISTSNITSSVSSIEFTGATGYTQYFLMLQVATDYTNVTMRFGIDGVYDSGLNYKNLTSSSGDSAFNINTSASKYGVHGFVNITDLARASTLSYQRASFQELVTVHGSTTSGKLENYGGYWGEQGNNSIQLIGTFVGGSASLYGISN